MFENMRPNLTRTRCHISVSDVNFFFFSVCVRPSAACCDGFFFVPRTHTHTHTGRMEKEIRLVCSHRISLTSNQNLISKRRCRIALLVCCFVAFSASRSARDGSATRQSFTRKRMMEKKNRNYRRYHGDRISLSVSLSLSRSVFLYPLNPPNDDRNRKPCLCAYVFVCASR